MLFRFRFYFLGAKLCLHPFLHLQNSLVNLFFRLKRTQKNLKKICGTDIIHINPLKATKWARKSIHHDVLLWDKKIPPSDLNNFVRNSAEPRFLWIILVLGWDFLDSIDSWSLPSYSLGRVVQRPCWYLRQFDFESWKIFILAYIYHIGYRPSDLWLAPVIVP